MSGILLECSCRSIAESRETSVRKMAERSGQRHSLDDERKLEEESPGQNGRGLGRGVQQEIRASRLESLLAAEHP